jgi:hypothetical protein
MVMDETLGLDSFTVDKLDCKKFLSLEHLLALSYVLSLCVRQLSSTFSPLLSCKRPMRLGFTVIGQQ